MTFSFALTRYLDGFYKFACLLQRCGIVFRRTRSHAPLHCFSLEIIRHFSWSDSGGCFVHILQAYWLSWHTRHLLLLTAHRNSCSSCFRCYTSPCPLQSHPHSLGSSDPALWSFHLRPEHHHRCYAGPGKDLTAPPPSLMHVLVKMSELPMTPGRMVFSSSVCHFIGGDSLSVNSLNIRTMQS